MKESFDLREFLTYAATVIRTSGWTSVADARAKGTVATATLVYKAARNEEPDEQALRIELDANLLPEDAELAELVADWAAGLPKNDKSKYLADLGTAARQGKATNRTFALLASAITAYGRNKQYAEKKAAREALAASKKHVGKVGEIETFLLTLKFSKAFDGKYGMRTLVKFEDSEGNELTWWASGQPNWIVGLTGPVKIKAKVKAHDTYAGVPQTVITRTSLVE